MTLTMAMIVAITVIGEVDVVDYNNDGDRTTGGRVVFVTLSKYI